MTHGRPIGQCRHGDLHFHINHVIMDDTNIHYLEIKAHCKICEVPMVFRGLPLGLSPHHPTGELGGGEARLPILGEGEEPTGKLIGFVGRVQPVSPDPAPMPRRGDADG